MMEVENLEAVVAAARVEVVAAEVAAAEAATDEAVAAEVASPFVDATLDKVRVFPFPPRRVEDVEALDSVAAEL